MRGVDLYDVIALAGLVLLGAGLWWIWPPLGLAVPGAILVVLGLVGAVARGRRGG